MPDTTPPVTGEIERFREILAEEYARENVYSKDASLKATYAKRLERAALSAMRRAYSLDRASVDGVRGVAYYVSAKGLGRTICGWVPVCGFSEPPGVLGLAEPTLWCELPAPPASDKE